MNRDEFEKLAYEWIEKTGYISSIRGMLKHESCREMLKVGKDAASWVVDLWTKEPANCHHWAILLFGLAKEKMPFTPRSMANEEHYWEQSLEQWRLWANG